MSILACALSLTCLPPAPQVALGGPQSEPRGFWGLLENGGFEGPGTPLTGNPGCPSLTGGVPAFWEENSCWVGNEFISADYAGDTNVVHTGAKSLRVELTDGIMQLAQYVPLEAGIEYRGSIWMRADGPVTVSFSLRKQQEPYTFYITRDVQLGTAWRQVSWSGFTESTDGFFMVRAEGDGSPRRIWVDDARLVAAPRELPLRDLAERPIDKRLFGMHFHDSGLPWPQQIGEAGAVRIWDADGPNGPVTCAQWTCCNPSQGVYDWSALDEHVARATAAGAQVLYNLGRTPRWASARPDEPSSYGPGQAAEPADMQDWRDWVTAVGTRYQGLVRHWEIWNEPNDPGFYSGSPETLIELAAEARAILKGIDLANQLLSPSPYDLQWFERYLKLGGGEFADGIGYHFYLIGEDPEFLYESYLPNALAIMERYGQGAKPLWNTEAGWYAPPTLPTEIGVGYLARTYLLNWAAGSERFYFYSFDGDPGAGVLLAAPPSYLTPTPAGIAYGELTDWLVGARLVDLERDGDRWTIELLAPDGARSHVVWHTAGPAAFTLPSAWAHDTVRRLDGSVTPLAPGATVTLGDSPLLLE